MVPRWHDQIRFGRNTVSSPSVLALEAGHGLWFDEGLIWLMDADIYQTCHDALGPPAIVPETLVANRLHAGQVSAGVSRGRRRRELRHVAAKHGLMRRRGDLRAFLYQYLKALG